MSLVPYVIEQTSRGERSYDIFSRLLKDSFGYTPSINIIVIPASYKLEEFKGDVKNPEDVKAFKPAPYDVAFTKTKPFIYGLINRRQS